MSLKTFRCRMCLEECTVLAVAVGHLCPKNRNKMVEFDLIPSPSTKIVESSPKKRKRKT